MTCTLSAAAVAAVPVEDMSTRDVRPQVTTPQPILPGSLQPGEQQLQAPAGGAEQTPRPVAAPHSVAPSAAGGLPAGQNAQLFYELQVLQSELQQLRGLVEDQAYEISRLRDLQRSQYLDIDRRLIESGRPGNPGGGPGRETAAPTALARSSANVTDTAGSAGPVSGAGTAARTVPSVPVQTGSGTMLSQSGQDAVAPGSAVTEPGSAEGGTAATGSVEPMTEQGSYTHAFELMKDQQFEQSIGAYQTVIENWPDGKYAPESRYWLGELYLMSDRLEDARGSFNQVVEAFPAHQKVPLSLYKLGVVNHRLGVTPKALEYLDDVVVRYPDTPAAGLARTYAAELR